jgi:PIF1 helicase.
MIVSLLCIAVAVLEGGRTACSEFKLPLELTFTEQPNHSVGRGSVRARILQECKLVVWDECPVLHKAA